MKRRRSLLGAAILAACLCALPRSSEAQSTITHAGGAAAASLNVAGIVNTSVSNTGSLPGIGGSLSAEQGHFELPSIADLRHLTASTASGNGRTDSQASVTDAALSVAGVYITASVVSSNVTAACYGDHAAAVSGSSIIAGLKVNGLPVEVTGAPNQRIPLPAGSLVLNEQISAAVNSPEEIRGDITVNALHLKINGAANVVIASSRAAVNCLPSPTDE